LNNRLLTTVAYQLDGKRTYALEGAIFIAGAAVQWLRDGLKVVKNAADTGALAKAADKNQSVYLVPAFVGLGAPYWNAEVRGALFGLTRATTNKELARAALEAVCYQTNDLLEAMKKDWGTTGETILRVDGGMTASDWTMQFLADILDAPVDRPMVLETTALGAAISRPASGPAAAQRFCQDPNGKRFAEDDKTRAQKCLLDGSHAKLLANPRQYHCRLQNCTKPPVQQRKKT
jgi:glycerol kinase